MAVRASPHERRGDGAPDCGTECVLVVSHTGAFRTRAGPRQRASKSTGAEADCDMPLDVNIIYVSAFN